jgi:hypothetical protein
MMEIIHSFVFGMSEINSQKTKDIIHALQALSG